MRINENMEAVFSHVPFFLNFVTVLFLRKQKGNLFISNDFGSRDVFLCFLLEISYLFFQKSITDTALAYGFISAVEGRHLLCMIRLS